MTSSTNLPVSERRLIAHYTSGRPGPTFVALAALHGNEPAGIDACKQVFQALSKSKMAINGQFIAIIGNRVALNADLRFIERDLNRGWDVEDIARLKKRSPKDDGPEDQQQRALLKLIDQLHLESTEPLVFLDLHTTSGHAPPFCAMADTLRNRQVAFALPIPTILGLEETIETALMGYLSELGHIGVVVEGGQHSAPDTPQYLESALWLTMAAAGLVEKQQIPSGHDLHHQRLGSTVGGLPQVVEIIHRHPVEVGDRFKMNPGYSSFQKIHQGEPLAEDQNGLIRAAQTGRILMPLYQPVGEDGFFITRDVDQHWLALSAHLRSKHMERLITSLPGVYRHPKHADWLKVDPKVAAFQTLNFFHLFGYRRRKKEGGFLTFSRRRPDHKGLLR